MSDQSDTITATVDNQQIAFNSLMWTSTGVVIEALVSLLRGRKED